MAIAVVPTNDRRLYWSHPQEWPKRTPEAVPLAHAAHLIGQAMFGKEWGLFEPGLSVQLAPPDGLESRRGLKHRAIISGAVNEIVDEDVQAAQERFWRVKGELFAGLQQG